jgi:3-deoxy-manno-octulosonate cytidylyltransferase (CMP-KDO synthetase)
MKVVALIPARLHSTRLPEKLMQMLRDKTVLQTTYINAVATNLFAEVIAICDSANLQQSILDIGGKALLSKKQHDTGTDRIAEFADAIDADVIINIQADEPAVNATIISALLEGLKKDQQAQIATPIYPIDADEAQNPNFVKVIADANMHAITFSRSVLPYQRNQDATVQYWKHVGIYAFRKAALLAFPQLSVPAIEQAEQLENLRFIYHGLKVRVVHIAEHPIGIDTAEDLARYRQLFC